MTSIQRTRNIDPITVADLESLGTASGPAVSVFMPTHRGGPVTREGPLRLRSLLDRAQAELVAQGVPTGDAVELVAPLRELGNRDPFWQHTADGLALYAAPGIARAFRLGTEVPEQFHVSGSFAVRPLVPAAIGDGEFLILALSQNSVRLFEATRGSVHERDIGRAPGSLDDAEGRTEREPQLQHQAAAGGTAAFHGHGAGGEVDRVMLQKFFRQVAAGIDELLAGPGRRPLVLASVAEHHPMLRDELTYPHLLDEVVAGNPDHASGAELQDKAWPIVQPVLSADAAAATERFGEALGTGLGLSDPAQIVTAASEGRVDTLLLTATVCRPEDQPGGLDGAVGHTCATSGRLVVLEALPHGNAVGAILRY
ncbi:baeRF3 domain-containing protein [Dietzia psychralcaliphila]|uniref:baeRF3 domain-containing protein n=1 Tax=Dietzia psychralcaliphila TaxID=139021 RepID=UPI001C1E6589|nr:hypothetical protein [Dietzia psychralcaliphila]